VDVSPLRQFAPLDVFNASWLFSLLKTQACISVRYCGARGAVFRDTPERSAAQVGCGNILRLSITSDLEIAIENISNSSFNSSSRMFISVMITNHFVAATKQLIITKTTIKCLLFSRTDKSRWYSTITVSDGRRRRTDGTLEWRSAGAGVASSCLSVVVCAECSLIVAKRCLVEQKLAYYWQPIGSRMWEIDRCRNERHWPLFGRTKVMSTITGTFDVEYLGNRYR